ESVLKQLHEGDINAFQAYSLLEAKRNKPIKAKRARFIKLHVNPEEESRKVKVLLSLLFALPLPLFIARWALDRGLKGKVDEQTGELVDIEEFKSLLKYAKGTTIDVHSKDATVTIKIL
ncbi:MAG: hypothetical protein ACOC14_04375, partial [Bacillota bacterium]